MSCNCPQIIKRYDELIGKFLVYRSFEDKYGMPESHVICENLFAQLTNELIIQQINIKLYHSTVQSEDWWKRYIHPNNFKNKDRYTREYIDRTTDGQNFKFAGVLENGMRILHKEVFPGVDVPRYYTSVFRNLLTEFGLVDEIQLFELMNTLRNLVHNSGVYTDRDKTINWKNKEYVFTQDKVPNFRYKNVDSYLDYYNDLIQCTIKLIDLMISSKK